MTTDFLKTQISGTIESIEKRRYSLKVNGIIESDDVVLQQFMSELRTLKNEYVKKMHVNEDGTPKEITQKDLGKGLVWVAYLSHTNRISSKDRNTVIDKLYEYYSGGHNDYSFANMFKLGMERRTEISSLASDNSIVIEDGSSRNNGERIRSDYRTYISDEFSKMDIRTITPEVLQEYSIQMLRDFYNTRGRKVKKKAFRENYRLVLNIAFDYASSQNICPNFVRDIAKFNPDKYLKLLDCNKKPTENVIFNKEQLDAMSEEIRQRFQQTHKYGICYSNGYMFLFARYTGLRIGEECALEKEDIDWDNNRIHVNKQQLCDKETDEYFVANYTKSENERGEIVDGRYVPLLPETREILLEMYEKQKQAGIKSKYVFANPDGSWIKKESQYTQFLERLSRKFGYKISNHHAIRKYFNSYVLIPAGIEVADRAKIMGHSIETNQNNYTFEHHDYCERSYAKLTNAKNAGNTGE